MMKNKLVQTDQSFLHLIQEQLARHLRLHLLSDPAALNSRWPQLRQLWGGEEEEKHFIQSMSDDIHKMTSEAFLRPRHVLWILLPNAADSVMTYPCQ